MTGTTRGIRGGVAIDIAGIRHVYPNGVEAVRRIDLSIQPGEFVSILGPSGCGKSTLLRLIAGLEDPTEGSFSIRTEGKTTFEPRRDVAFVFQDAHLLPWRTVIQNVALPLELQGIGKAQRLQTAEQMLEWVGLEGFQKKLPGQLSGGMRMRVSIARALSLRPKLLLMDEPFAALDEISRQKLDELLLQLWAVTGMTTLFVTHSTQEAVYLGTRAVVLSGRPGRVVLDTPIDLPPERPAAIRGEIGFVEQTRRVFAALELRERDDVRAGLV